MSNISKKINRTIVRESQRYALDRGLVELLKFNDEMMASGLLRKQGYTIVAPAGAMSQKLPTTNIGCLSFSKQTI